MLQLRTLSTIFQVCFCLNLRRFEEGMPLLTGLRANGEFFFFGIFQGKMWGGGLVRRCFPTGETVAVGMNFSCGEKERGRGEMTRTVEGLQNRAGYSEMNPKDDLDGVFNIRLVLDLLVDVRQRYLRYVEAEVLHSL